MFGRNGMGGVPMMVSLAFWVGLSLAFVIGFSDILWFFLMPIVSMVPAVVWSMRRSRLFVQPVSLIKETPVQ